MQPVCRLKRQKTAARALVTSSTEMLLWASILLVVSLATVTSNVGVMSLGAGRGTVKESDLVFAHLLHEVEYDYISVNSARRLDGNEVPSNNTATSGNNYNNTVSGDNSVDMTPQNQSDANSCALPCRNGGTCRIHQQDINDEQDLKAGVNSNDTTSMVCDCPSDDIHGDLCQFQASPCGDNGQCMHGSICVEPRGNADGFFFCDCTAKRRGVGVGYAGRYCQYQATSYCAINHNGLVFCVNDGRCHEEGNAGSGIFSCICPDGFHGPSCEFANEPNHSNTTGESGNQNSDNNDGAEQQQHPDDSSDDAKYEICTMPCQNGGACRKGVKDVSGTSGYALLLTQHGDDRNSDLSNATVMDNEHCVCPRGYFGIHCETQVEECLSDDDQAIEHICLHGSKCVRQDSDTAEPWRCDCEQAYSESLMSKKRYTGKFCQHHHTSVCHPTSSSIYEGPSTTMSFCVNDGVCIDIKEEGESHTGCHCPEGYTGQHCELLASVRIPMGGYSGPFAPSRSSAAIPFVLAVLAIVLAVLVIAIVVRYREYRKQLKRNTELTHMQQIAGRRSYRDNEDNEGDAIMDGESFHDSMELEEIDLL